jgi:hypothetical protein
MTLNDDFLVFSSPHPQGEAFAFSPPQGDEGSRPGRRGGSVAWERSDSFATARHDRAADPEAGAPGILRRGPAEPMLRFHWRICFGCLPGSAPKPWEAATAIATRSEDVTPHESPTNYVTQIQRPEIPVSGQKATVNV